MIEAISTVAPATQAAGSPVLQSHAQPFAPAAANPVQAKHFAQHLAHKAPDSAAPVKSAEAGVQEPNPIRDRLNQASKRIETGVAEYERLEGELQKAGEANDLPKSLSLIGKMSKEAALGLSAMNMGVTAAGTSVGVFQNLLRVSER